MNIENFFNSDFTLKDMLFDFLVHNSFTLYPLMFTIAQHGVDFHRQELKKLFQSN